MSSRVAFVTGASRGIGKASAIALAEAGYDVVLTARTIREGEQRDYGATFETSALRAMPGSLEVTASAVRERGRRALPLRLDLLDPISIDAAIDAALETWGPVDLLLNNGIFQGPGLMDRFLDLPMDAVHRIFQGNVFGQIQITQRILPSMLETGGGIIINMTSTAARTSPPGPTGDGGWGFGYAASKAAFHRMAGLLHVEHGERGIRAYNVDPGYVTTEAIRSLAGDDLDERHTGAPPEVPAAVVAWLGGASEAAIALRGRTVAAPELCAERELLPGWPPTSR